MSTVKVLLIRLILTVLHMGQKSFGSSCSVNCCTSWAALTLLMSVEVRQRKILGGDPNGFAFVLATMSWRKICGQPQSRLTAL